MIAVKSVISVFMATKQTDTGSVQMFDVTRVICVLMRLARLIQVVYRCVMLPGSSVSSWRLTRLIQVVYVQLLAVTRIICVLIETDTGSVQLYAVTRVICVLMEKN